MKPRNLTALLVLLLLQFGQQIVHADDIIKLRTQNGIAGWAVDPDSGELFAAWPSKNSILRFDINGQIQPPEVMKGRPVWLTVKKKQLFAVEKNGHVSCFAILPKDLGDLSARGIGSQMGFPPINPENNDHHLYFFAMYEEVQPTKGNRRTTTKLKIVKYDVARKMKVGEAPLSANPREVLSPRSFESASLSPNGKHLFLAAGITGRLFDFDEQTLSLSENHSFKQMRVRAKKFICNFDSSSRYIGFPEAPLIRLSDLAKIEFLGGAVQVHEKYDLAVSIGPKDSIGRVRLFFQRFSDRKLLKIVELVASPENKNFPDTPEQSLLKFTIDDKLWLALDDDAWLINLEMLALPKQPKIDVEIPNMQVVEGGKFALDLAKNQPSDVDGVKWELLKGPQGMSLDDERLNWKPGPDQKGPFKVSVRLTAGKQSIETTFDVNVVVDNPSVEIGGYISDMGVNPAGDIAVCHCNPRGENRYVAVDLDSGKVLSSCEIDVPIRNLVLTDKYIYYIEREKDWMLCRRRYDSLDAVERTDMLTQILSLDNFSNNELALTTGEPAELFRLPANSQIMPDRDQFKPGILLKTDNRGIGGRSFGLSRQRGAGAGNFSTGASLFSQFSKQRLYVNGIIRDAATGKPLTIVDNILLPIYKDKDSKLGFRYRDISPMPLPFGNTINYESRGFGTPKKSKIFDVSPFASRLSRKSDDSSGVVRTKSLSQFMPAIFACVKTETSLLVTAFSNVGNRRVAQVELESGVFEATSFGSLPVPFKDGLVVPFEDRIHLFKLTEMQKSELQQPLEFVYPNHVEITASTKESIQLQTLGGIGEVKFKKLNTDDGMLLNEETGEIVIDTTELVCGYNALKTFNASKPEALAPLKNYNDLFGTHHNPNSELGLYPVSVEAKDSVGQRAMICFFVAISKLKASGFEKADDGKGVVVALPPPITKKPVAKEKKQPTQTKNEVAANDSEDGELLTEQEKKIQTLESTSKSIEQQLKGIEALLKKDSGGK